MRGTFRIQKLDNGSWIDPVDSDDFSCQNLLSSAIFSKCDVRLNDLSLDKSCKFTLKS